MYESQRYPLSMCLILNDELDILVIIAKNGLFFSCGLSVKLLAIICFKDEINCKK